MITPDITKYAALYSSETSEPFEFHDCSREDGDIRWMAGIQLSGQKKIALKVTNNSFTTPERIRGWAALMEYYNQLGIYCPKIIPNIHGDLFAEIDGCLAYAEEYVRYRPAQERDGADSAERRYEQALFESIGLVAANPAPLVPWHTAYCIYDKFEESYECDDTCSYAKEFCKIFMEHYPEFSEKAVHMLEEYLKKREEFEPVYRSLPQAVFQGDINDTNILIGEEGEFRGMIDFNLSGTETILNYTFCESFGYMEDDEYFWDTLDQKNTFQHCDEETAKMLSWIGKNYRFTREERDAFPTFYNLVAPFRWPYYCRFRNALLNERGCQYVNQIWNWVEYQFSRTDTAKLLP